MVEEIFRIHPCVSELVRGELLHGADSFLVEEFHVVTRIAEEKIVCSYTEPEQMQFAVGVGCIIIDIRYVCRRERTVTTQIRELVKVRQTVEQSLVSTA